MRKMKLIFTLLIVTALVACGQKAQVFDKVATFNAGFRFSPTGTIYTSLPTGGTADWNTLLNKPATFPSTWATVSGKPTLFDGTWASLTGKPTTFAPTAHNHDLLYRPITWKPDYNTDILNIPDTTELSAAILQVPVLFQILTQVQINALTPVRGQVVINSTDNIMQWYNGTEWVIFVTNK